ncbi:MAG: DICT sensory domain-containing protein [Verrucomicrobiota bacterium]
MIIDTREERQTHKRFTKSLKPYLADGNVAIHGYDPNQEGLKKIVKLGERAGVPEVEITHIFNNQAMLAISHAIEDIASEVRNGELISTFQRFDNFKPQKKRYLGLAEDLDAVRVWGEGDPPKRCPKIDFVPVFRNELKRYWVVIFTSPETNAALICRQINRSSKFDKKVFAGFYTFNPFLVESMRRQFNLMSVGLDRVINQWEKEVQIPSISFSEIKNYFQESESSQS